MNLNDINILLTTQPKPKLDETQLGFGKHFSDHMFEMDYTLEKGWHNATIKQYEPFLISPACSTIHYGQAVFEGMKAYIANNNVVLFRPLDNLNRLNRSARRVALPEIDVHFVLSALEKLLEIDKHWIPQSNGSSLYIRPFMFASEETLGVSIANKVKFMIILSPSGAYFKDGLQPNKIYIENEYVRAVKGGVGDCKVAGNYAASLLGQQKASQLGYAQTLWLDAIEHKYIEEVGAMNIFFKIDGKFITPELNGSILPGITRDSIIKLLKHNNEIVEERKISIDEVISAYQNNTLEEVFGCGTAAVISPVGELFDGTTQMIINNFTTGKATEKLYNQLVDIQLGKETDPFNWIHIVTSL